MTLKRSALAPVVLAVAAGLFLAGGLPSAEREIPFRHVLIDPHNVGADCKAVGDLNGDGFPDVAVADDTGIGLQWYVYPKWTKHVIDPRSVFTTDMQIGDVDRDGDLDIVVPDIRENRTLWYRNPLKGGGDWKPFVIGSPYGHDVEIGDVNRDGRLDVVARTGDTTVFIQKSPTLWEKATIRTGGRGGTSLGDLDRDGDLDIAQNGYWLECPKDPVHGTWLRHDAAGGWPDDSGVAVADMNGDRRPDLLLAPAETDGKLVWYAAPADPKHGKWAEHLIDGEVSCIHTFKVADMDRDGDLDVVTGEMEQSPEKRVSIYRNGGKALRWSRQTLSTKGTHNLRVADIGHDGDMDVVGTNWGSGPDAYAPVELWENLIRDSKPKVKKESEGQASGKRGAPAPLRE